MTLKVERENLELNDPMLEFLNWLEELKRLRNEFDALLCQYEDKRARLIESLRE